MLKKGEIFFWLTLIFSSCTNNSVNVQDKDIRQIVESKIGTKSYLNLYHKMSDTLTSWEKNYLLFTDKDIAPTYTVDSTFVINNSNQKVIGILHFQSNLVGESADGIQEFFGAKIDGQWYFWRGGYTPVGRTNLKNHDPTKPLPYSYLHQMGVGSLSGYLDKDGNIRDEWFEAKFKSGHFPFKDRYKYKHILDGKRIDNETDYWEYIWKKKGQMLWRRKAYQDSIALREQLEGKPLADEEKREISSN